MRVTPAARPVLLALAASALVALTAAVTLAGATAQATGSVVYLVRHAETDPSAGEPGDPPLSAEGQARAARLAEMLSSAGLTSVSTTPRLRTRSTAAAVAARAGVEVREYQPLDKDAVAALLARVRQPGRHLIVGHSNTVPGLVDALGGDSGDPIGEREYDRLYVVVPASDGRAVSTLLRYGQR